MKNLIVNIYKTLFFFDFAIVAAYYLPDIKTESTALLTLWNEGVFFAVALIFTLVFLKLVERKRLRVFNFKNKLRHYSLGLMTAVIPLGVTVLCLWAFKMLRFNGVTKPDGILLWLAALLLNAAANELLLRGYLFRLYRKFYSLPAVTVIITLLFFSLNVNIFSGGIIYAANMLLSNILLCLLAEYSYSLLAPITAHFFYNVISCFLFGSASVSKDYPALLNIIWSGNKNLSGGDLKIEGSIILLAVNLALAAYFTVKLRKRARYGESSK